MGPGPGMKGDRWGSGYTRGWAVTAPEERAQHRDQMRAMKTYDECKAFWAQNREFMAARARKRGSQMPAQPRRNARGSPELPAAAGWDTATPQALARQRAVRQYSSQSSQDGGSIMSIRVFWPRAGAVLLAGVVGAVQAASYGFTPIASSNQDQFLRASIAADGTVAFLRTAGEGSLSLELGSGSGATTTMASTLGSFRELFVADIAADGRAAFIATEELAGSRVTGLYVFDQGQTRLLTRSDVQRGHPDVSINREGYVAFGDGGDLFRADAAGAVVPALLGGGQVLSLGGINNRGDIAAVDINNVIAVRPLRGTGFTVANTTGISSFAQFVKAGINDARTVAFTAKLKSGGQGVFYSSRGAADTGTIADNLGDFGSFVNGGVSINAEGGVAFFAADPRDRSLFSEGIFTGGTLESTVVQLGDPLFGSTVVWLELHSEAINDAGQIAFSYRLANGESGVARADLVASPGDTSSHPRPPDFVGGGEYVFFDPSANWCDPPLATGFTYSVVGGSFKSVMLAPGFEDLQIVVDGKVVASGLDGGEFFFFASGVQAFSVLGIDPPVDAEDPMAFPTYLSYFGTPTELRMKAVTTVDETGSGALLLAGLAVLHRALRRKAPTRGRQPALG